MLTKIIGSHNSVIKFVESDTAVSVGVEMTHDSDNGLMERKESVRNICLGHRALAPSLTPLHSVNIRHHN
jgi:hypothetical protein